MQQQTKLKFLSLVLYLTAFIFVIGLPLLTYFWPSAWMWEPRQYEYEQMILGVYMTLGVFIFFAAKNPLQHFSLIWFTIVSSFVHGIIMLVQALVDKTEHANLHGDVPGLLILALLLAVLMPRKRS